MPLVALSAFTICIKLANKLLRKFPKDPFFLLFNFTRILKCLTASHIYSNNFIPTYWLSNLLISLCTNVIRQNISDSKRNKHCLVIVLYQLMDPYIYSLGGRQMLMFVHVQRSVSLQQSGQT